MEESNKRMHSTGNGAPLRSAPFPASDPCRCAFKNLLHFQKPWFGQELEGGRLMRALDEIQMGEHSQSELIPTACKECDNEHAFCMQV